MSNIGEELPYSRRQGAGRIVFSIDKLLPEGCLDALWVEVVSGRRRFKLYRQMKMYNDPELNPVLYEHPR